MSTESIKPYAPNHRFLVSDLGRVFDTSPGKVHTHAERTEYGVVVGQASVNGYRNLIYRDNGAQRHVLVHVMVATTFIGPPPFHGALVRHRNDVKHDNRVDNLAWGTQQDNSDDAVRNGRIPIRIGESSPTHKLKERDVLDIRHLFLIGATQAHIAEAFGVSECYVSDICRCKKSWKHLSRFFHA